MLARMLEKQHLTDINITLPSSWDEYATKRRIGSFDSEPTRSYEYLISLSPKLKEVPLEVLANRWSPEMRNELRIELIHDHPSAEPSVISAFRCIELHSLKLYEELRENLFEDLVNNEDLMGYYKYRTARRNRRFAALLSQAQALRSQMQPWNQPSRGYGIALLNDFDGREESVSATVVQFKETLKALESFYVVLARKGATKIEQSRRTVEQLTEMESEIYALRSKQSLTSLTPSQ
jgi:hypothetical protein